MAGSELTAGVNEHNFLDISPVAALENHEESDSQHSTASINKKKKPIYPSQQKIHEASLALNSGKEHINSLGKLKPARMPRAPCNVKCKRCAVPRLTEAERFAVSKDFWELQNHEKQWLFIHKSIKLSIPKRKCSVKGAKGEKLVNREYCFCISNDKRKVCKTMFKNTLNICDSWIVNALSHCADGQVTKQDSRGKRTKTQR